MDRPLWSSYDTVQGYTDYANLTWWSNDASQTGTTTHRAVGVNMNDLSQVDWGVTVANPNLSPNGLDAGDLGCYYTQTRTGLTPSFTVGYDTAAMTVSPTSKESFFVTVSVAAV